MSRARTSQQQAVDAADGPAGRDPIPEALFDQLADSVGVYARDGRVLYLNRATEVLFGKSRPELTGRVLWEVFPDAVGNPFHQAFLRVAQTGKPEHFDHHYRPWDRWFENRIYLAGDLVYVLARDVTAERNARDAQRADNARLQTLAEASRAFSDAPSSLGTLLDTLAAQVVAHLADACSVALISADGLWVDTVAIHDVRPAAREAFVRMAAEERMRLGEGIVGKVAQTGEPVFLPSIPRELLERAIKPEYRELLAGTESFSVVAVPLKARDRVVGSLQASRRAPRQAFTREDQTLLQEIADRAALGIEAARLFEAERAARAVAERIADQTRRLQRATSTLSRTLHEADAVEIILQEGVDALGASTAGLWRTDGASQTLQLVSDRGYPATQRHIFATIPLNGKVPLAEAVRSGAPVWIESWEQYAARYPESEARARPARTTAQMAIACLPVFADGKVVAGIAFGFPGARAIDEADRTFISLLVQQGAQAIGRARAFAREKEIRARLETVVSASPAAILVLDLDGTVRLWNPAAERIFGWSAAEAVGRYFPAVPETRRSEFATNLQRISGGTPIVGLETQRLTKSGQLIDVALYGAPLANPDGPTQCLWLVMDISARKQAEAVLRRSEESARFVDEATAILGSTLEPDEVGQRLAHNLVPRLADWCGLSLLDEGGNLRQVALAHADAARLAEGRAAMERFPSLPDEKHGLANVIRTGRPELYPVLDDALLAAVARGPEHLEILRSSGLTSGMLLPLSARGRTFGALYLLMAESGRHYGPADFELAQELSRRGALAIDNARLFLEAQRAVRLRDEFLSVASHELKTPLTSLRLQLELLFRGAGGDERLSRRQDITTRQLQRLSSLVESLLDVSRISTGRMTLEPEPVDLTALVAEVVARFEPEAERAGSHLSAQLGKVDGIWDRLRLEQVVTNLVHNAIKYGAGRPIELTVTSEGEQAVVAVRDQGIGIAPENQARIFGRFERGVDDRNYGGLGLGLYIARTLVEAMGGKIGVQSALGQGATFWVGLPRTPPGRAST